MRPAKLLFILLSTATLLRPTTARAADNPTDWLPFTPKDTPAASAIDLRSLNEPLAGDHGFIGVKNEDFIHTATGEPVRFWAVTNCPGDTYEELTHSARVLASYGVNQVRLHGALFNDKGAPDTSAITHAFDTVDALKHQGIYTHFSIYFPLWYKPATDDPILKGYDGKTTPFAVLFFNKEFQTQYRSWWKALLTTPSPRTGKSLIDEPAVSSLELLNEDSYFFWTFVEEKIPLPQRIMIENQYAAWLIQKYGSLEKTQAAWGKVTDKDDKPAENRMGFRPPWNTFTERTQRDQDAVAFLAESERAFYTDTIAYIRQLGFKGPITCSNWITASPEILTPIEKWIYTTGDFLDRHGYVTGPAQGPDSAWAIKPGLTYADFDALTFGGDKKNFQNPIMDIHYNNKPSMISEVAFNRPNRFRTEAPLYMAAYGCLQNTAAITHFAFDGARFSVKPRYFMQPWTLMSPTQMAQFPAAARIFRLGLLSPGDVMATLNFTPKELLSLKGTPMPQDASIDQLRLKDIPAVSTTLKPGNLIDPLIHFVGQTNVNFTQEPPPPTLKDLSPFIDRKAGTVTSSNHQLHLDFTRGLLTLNAPQAQGFIGNAGTTDIKLADITCTTPLDLAAFIAVSLDGKPLATSAKILLQVMSEERPTGMLTEPAPNGQFKITNIGRDPWTIKPLAGKVTFSRPDAAALTIQPLDLNGVPSGNAMTGATLTLRPGTLYYLITKP